MLIDQSNKTYTDLSVMGGIGFENASSVHDVTLLRCHAKGCSTGISFGGAFPRRNIIVDGCTIEDLAAPNDPTHGSGIYASLTDGFRVRNSRILRNEWKEMAHGAYMAWNTMAVFFENTLVHRCGYSGLELRGGGTIDSCIFASCPIGIACGGGGDGEFVPGGVDVLIRNCVIMDCPSPRMWGISVANARVVIEDSVIDCGPNMASLLVADQTRPGHIASTVIFRRCVFGPGVFQGFFTKEDCTQTMSRSKPLTRRELALSNADLLAMLKRRYGL